MSVLLLRTLTRKSIIGFGTFREWSVQNMIDMCKTYELLSIYYTCRNIDFNQDLKDELCIYGEREIDKKHPSAERYIENGNLYPRLCMRDIIDKKDEDAQKREIGLKRKFKFEKKRRLNNKEIFIQKTVFSKGAQQARNHRHNKN